LTFANRQTFLDRYTEDKEMAGVYITGHTYLLPNDLLDVEFAFADDRMVFHTHVVVRDRFVEPQNPRSPGLLLVFLPSEERGRQLLVDYASGKSRPDVKRRPRRFRVSLAAEYATEGDFKRAMVADLSRDGAFLHTEELLDSGTLVILRILPPHGQSIQVPAEVAWRQEKPLRGFGVRFLTGDPEKQQKIVALVDSSAMVERSN